MGYEKGRLGNVLQDGSLKRDRGMNGCCLGPLQKDRLRMRCHLVPWWDVCGVVIAKDSMEQETLRRNNMGALQIGLPGARGWVILAFLLRPYGLTCSACA